jgi:DNA-binding NarL/FixJ family response regulator
MPKTVKILLVEDEVLIAMQMEMELTRKGYDVYRSVSKGEEAIEVVRESKPDLILMDIRLAGDLDGIETGKQILTQHEIPIIFMTGYPDDVVRNRAMQLHPIGYFLKPVHIHQIETAIHSIMNTG